MQGKEAGLGMKSDKRLLLFAGTTEGRRLFEWLADRGVPVDASAATAYGGELLRGGGCARVLTGRMDEAAMAALLQENAYALVVDATHPYAREVTANIRAACAETGTPFCRLLRPEAAGDGVDAFPTLEKAVAFLAKEEGAILSTIGSKELAALTALPGYRERVFARVLPLPQVVEECTALGFEGKNLIAMQGPFSYELNLAMLRQYGCRFLLTKDSGKAGGMEEKWRAAVDAGARVVLISRPPEADGLPYDEVLARIAALYGLPVQPDEPKPGNAGNTPRKGHFPLFIPTKGRTVLVVGGGAIAGRRVRTLCRFDWTVKVVAPEAGDAVRELAESGALIWEKREFQPGDLDGVYLVTAATDCREVNRQVGELAREIGVFASIADAGEEGSFYFPAIAEMDTVVAGLAGDGRDHTAVKEAAARVRAALSDDDR